MGAFITGTDFMCDGGSTKTLIFNNLITDCDYVVGIFYICTKLIIL